MECELWHDEIPLSGTGAVRLLCGIAEQHMLMIEPL